MRLKIQGWTLIVMAPYILFTLSCAFHSNLGDSYVHFFITSISEAKALLALASSFSVSLLLVLFPDPDLSEVLDTVKAFRLASRASFSLISPLCAATTSGNSILVTCSSHVVIRDRLCHIIKTLNKKLSESVNLPRRRLSYRIN
jgi:hypothetical protein